MDTKQYYAQVREMEAQIAGPEAQVIRDAGGRITAVLGGIEEAVIISRATPDGGVPGVLKEVTRYRAARMIVDRTAEPATPEQAKAYREKERRATEEEKRRRAAQEIKVSVITREHAEALAPEVRSSATQPFSEDRTEKPGQNSP